MPYPIGLEHSKISKNISINPNLANVEGKKGVGFPPTNISIKLSVNYFLLKLSKYRKSLSVEQLRS